MCPVLGTVHLFIGTGRSPNKITFVSLITNHNQNTNYQGLNGLLLFKSVLPFVSRRCHAEAPWIIASACTFVLWQFAFHTAEGVFAWRTFGEEEGPQQCSTCQALDKLPESENHYRSRGFESDIGKVS
jgi:hypothetical protein